MNNANLLGEKGTLPSGWRWVRLDSMFDVKQGVAMSPTRRQGLAPFPFLRTLNIQWGYVDLSNLDKMDFSDDEVSILNLRKGDLLVCEGGDVGRTAIWKGELDTCLYQNHIHRLRRKNDSITPDFYALWLRAAFTVFNSYRGEASTTTIPNLSGGSLKSFLVPLPPTPDEQKRIVSMLNEQLATVKKARLAAEASLEAANLLLPSYLRKILNSNATKAWPIRTLDNLCRDITDGTHVTPEYIASGIPFLSVKDIREDAISFDNCRYISNAQHELLSKRCKCERDDVLYTKVGTTGIAKEIDIDREFSIFVSVALLKLHKGLDPKYIATVLNSSIGRLQAAQLTQGVANRNLVIKDIKRIAIPVPSIEKQIEIVSEFNQVSKVFQKSVSMLAEELDSISALSASLFRNAFVGKV